MQRSNRGHFSSRIQKIFFISFLNAPSIPKGGKKKTVDLWFRRNKMLYDKYHEFFFRQCNILRQKNPTFRRIHNIFYLSEGRQMWGQEALVRWAAVSLLHQEFLRRKEGIEKVANSIKIKGRSLSTSWENLSSICHQGQGNEGMISASHLSRFLYLSKSNVLLEMVVNVGHMAHCPSCNKVSAL